MLQVDAAIIGGTGVGERLLGIPGEVVHVPTTEGFLRGLLLEIGERKVFAVSRHSAGHKVPPHRVKYAAMALALRDLGARVCFSTAAVGSLKLDWTPGTLVACSDFIDDTGRHPTLFNSKVVHTDFGQPFPARMLLTKAAADLNLSINDGGVYVCGNGPRYETPEEVQLYAKWGGDIVGMTAATEAILMREAGVPYACLAVVTNLAAGLSCATLEHEEVAAEMVKSGKNALDIILKAVSDL